MEQNRPSDQVIVDWLRDYSHFICDRFSLPHHKAGEILQEYLEITARDPAQQPVTSLHEQQTSHPEGRSPEHTTHHREPFPNSDLPTSPQTQTSSGLQAPNPNHQRYLWDQVPTPQPSAHLQTQPLDYSKVSNPYHEAHDGVEAAGPSTITATEFRNTINQGPFTSSDPQSGGITPVNSNSAETGAYPPLPIPPVNQNPIGSIHQYDPHWVQHADDVAAVRRFSSAMKFDTLFHAGIINIGDVLKLQVCISSNGQPPETEAHLSIIGVSRPPGGRGNLPDLSITLLSNPNMQYPIAMACKGTTAMIEHLEACNITVNSSSWRDIQIYRGQQALGSLWWVKQAFHLWRDRKDQEAQETGQHFRRRRAAGVRHHKGLFGVWRGGQFVPDPDQTRFRGRG